MHITQRTWYTWEVILLMCRGSCKKGQIKHDCCREAERELEEKAGGEWQKGQKEVHHTTVILQLTNNPATFS